MAQSILVDSALKPNSCSVDGCDRTILARKMCSLHYQRMLNAGLLPAPPTDEERFWSCVNKQGPFHPILQTQCWLWTATLSTPGYGQFCNSLVPGRSASRYSFRLAFGEYDLRMCVLHKCDTPACVRPDHLFLGTQQDNVTDMIRKGRNVNVGLAGELNSASKLTESDVRQIRQDTRRAADIAKDFGVSKTTVARVKRGEIWAWVE